MMLEDQVVDCRPNRTPKGRMPWRRTTGRTTIACALSWSVVSTLMSAAILCAASGQARAGGVLDLDYSDAIFSSPLVIDNPYWPLNPDGMERTFTSGAETEDGCVIEEATVYGAGPFKTLDGAAPYTGHLAVVVEDIGYIDEDCTGLLADRVKQEHTFDWYREDDDGNIWYVGELSLDYELDGCGDTSIDPSPGDMAVRPQCYIGSWEAGKGPVDGLIAEAGIVVPSDDPTGTGEPLTEGTWYLQEEAEDAMDVAKILKTAAKVKYRIDGVSEVFEPCRVTKEYSAIDSGAIEQKNYCPDDGGLVVVEELAGGKSVLVVLQEVEPPLP